MPQDGLGVYLRGELILFANPLLRESIDAWLEKIPGPMKCIIDLKDVQIEVLQP